MNKNESQKSSLDYYKSIFLDNAVECAWVYSLTDKCFKYISPSVFNLRGFTVEEAMNESLEDSLTPESLQKIKNSGLKRYPRFISGDRSEEIVSDISEYEQYCKDGSTKIIEISTRLIYSETTNSIDVFGISRDITIRIQYENELLEKLREKTELLENRKPLLQNELLNVRIYFFDKFLVFGVNQSEPLHWHTFKNEELFVFFLSQDSSSISKDLILDNLWPDIDAEKAITYLHNTLCSMKKDLKSIGIDFQTRFKNNHYFFEFPEYYSDIQHFSKIIENTVLPFDSVDEHSVDYFEQILKLYTGDYLHVNGYLWSLATSTKLSKQFKSAALALSRFYFFKHDYSSTKRVLLSILKIDNYDESIHELLLKVYLQDNDYSAFLNHYTELELFLFSECNSKPQNSIQSLYNNFYFDAKQCTEKEEAHF
ncbi:MAG: PAS domain S-box protein [Velocimicrobium sp.]